MITALIEHFGKIFYGPIVVGIGAAVLLFELVVMVMASRRRRRADAPPLSMKVHALAGAVIAAFPIAVGISVHAARSLMFQVYFGDGADPSEKATALSRGMSGQMNAIPFAVDVTLLALALWFVGVVQTLRPPRSGGGIRVLPPAALVGFGLLPVAAGGVRWSTSLIKAFAGMAGLPPETKSAILERALDAARLDFTRFATLSMASIPFLATAAIVLIVARGRSAGDTRTAAPARSASLPVAISAAAIALAAVLLFAVRPTAAENELPWPPTIGSQFVWPGGPPTPDLLGPDPVARAPVVTVFRDSVKLDGASVDDLTDLELKLGTLANNFKLLHPGGDFNEMALIEADGGTSFDRLTAVLRAIRGAWYYRPMFAFTKKEAHVRPVFGRIERVVATGARFRLGFTDDEEDDAEWKSAVPLRLEDFADYDAFARRLVELRGAGKPVLVKIERSAR